MIFFLLETTAKSPTSQSWKPWRGSGKRNYRNFILTLLGSFPKVCISIHYTDTYQFTLQQCTVHCIYTDTAGLLSQGTVCISIHYTVQYTDTYQFTLQQCTVHCICLVVGEKVGGGCAMWSDLALFRFLKNYTFLSIRYFLKFNSEKLSISATCAQQSFHFQKITVTLKN